MKQQIPYSIFFLFLSSFILAQEDVLVINGGNDNEGLLETTINGDTTASGERVNPNRIYELKANQIYTMNAPIIVENPDGVLTIRGQEGGTKPVILKHRIEGIEVISNTFNSSLTIKNIQFHNMELDGHLPWTAFEIKGANHHLKAENCLIENASGIIFNLNNVLNGAKIRISNCYFRDLHNGTAWWAGRVVQAKVPVDTFIFENNTVTGAGLMVLGQECLFEYSEINHNTMINCLKTPFYNQYWKELYFTNNLFVNVNFVGEDMENVATGGADPNSFLHGILDIKKIDKNIRINPKFVNDDYSLTEEVDSLNDIIYYSADNVLAYSETFDNYYSGGLNDNQDFDAPESYLTWGGMEGPFEVINVPSIWSNERSEEIVASYDNIKEENNRIYELMATNLGMEMDPLPQDAADAIIKWNRVHWGVPNVEVPSDDEFLKFQFGDFDPTTIPGIETENSNAGGIKKFSDMIEDFAINPIQSKSDGMRIGALHWNDEPFEKDSSIARIKDAYLGMYRSYTPIGSQKSIVKSEVGLRNIPNPFSSSTRIEFELQKATHVNLSVYDMSGRLLVTLIDQDMHKGIQGILYNPAAKVNGPCFCKLKTSEYAISVRMIVLETRR